MTNQPFSVLSWRKFSHFNVDFLSNKIETSSLPLNTMTFVAKVYMYSPDCLRRDCLPARISPPELRD